MRRSWTIGLLSMLGLGLAFTFSCAKENNDDDDSYNPTLGSGGKVTADDDDSKADDDDSKADDDDSTADDDDSNDPGACENIEGLVDETCLSQGKFSKAIPVNMLIVLDKSGSMESESAYGQPKWQALTSALGEALNADEMINNPEMSVGLMLFPGDQVIKDCPTQDCCALSETDSKLNVEIGPAADTVPAIVDTLGGVTPTGLTPTASALTAALDYFTSGAGQTLEGDKYVLLATDGGPNCNESLTCGDDQCTLSLDGSCKGTDCCASGDSVYWCVDSDRTQGQIQALADAGVKTIVVGIPGSEAYNQWLNGFADAGGAQAPTAAEGGPSYYEVAASGGVSALTKTFKDITVNLVRSCRIQLDYSPPSNSPWLVNVALNCSAIPQGGQKIDGAAGAAAVSETNWIIDDSTQPATVEILGSYCEKIQKGVERVDIVVGCPPRL